MKNKRLAYGLVLACTAGVLALTAVIYAERTGLNCLSYGPKGPPTHADGTVAVSTDASVCTPNGNILITAINRTGVPIYLFPQMVFYEANCWGIELERRDHGTWESADLVDCAHGDTVPLYAGYADRLAPGDVITIQMIQPHEFATTGTYRVIMRYVPESAVLSRFAGRRDPSATPLALYPTAAPITSAPFRVCVCARCP